MYIYTYTYMYSSRSHKSAERDRKTETEGDRERGYSKVPSLLLMVLQVQGRWSWRIVILEFDDFFQMNLRLSNRLVYKAPDYAEHTERKCCSVVWHL